MINERTAAAAARTAEQLFESLVREQPNDVLVWLRGCFMKVYDFDTARQWLSLSAEQKRQFIDELSGESATQSPHHGDSMLHG